MGFTTPLRSLHDGARPLTARDPGTTQILVAQAQYRAHSSDRHERFFTCVITDAVSRATKVYSASPACSGWRRLPATLAHLSQGYQLRDRQGILQDYCPSCKRVLRGEAYYRVMGDRFA